ncbi:hypothetical protein [Mangrovicoccus sp. HB161399]|uniref:hypothetical protein n=1 Tax=Mangrovicoccus sp. HB161399 TaxID=2720392 RepID=UPI001554FE35|nr:hypothetical protein [Mangrovicoccus sp. HB161399]
MRDLFNNIGTNLAMAPAVQTAAATGPAIDLQGAGRIAFAVSTGAIVGSGDFGVTLQDSDDGSTGWADVAAADLQTNAPATLEESGAYRLGYLGDKRFVRLSLTMAGGTSIAAGAVAVLGSTLDRPVG